MKSKTTAALLRAACLLLTLAPAAAADTITGQVVDSNGVGVPGVNLDVKSLSGGGNPTILNDGTGPGGFFNTTLPAGKYRVTFTPPPPPASSHLVLEVDDVVVVGITSMGVVTLPEGVSVSGRAVNPAGAGVAGVNLDVIDLSNGDNLTLTGDTTNAFGQFAVAVPKGAVELRFNTLPVVGVPLAPRSMRLDLAASTALGDVALVPGRRVSATLRGPGGVPLQGVDTDVFDVLTGEKLYTPSDNSDAAGAVSVLVPAGTFEVEFCPPFATKLVARSVANVVVAGDVALGVLPFEAGFVLSGIITGGGVPLANADVDVAAPVTGVQVTLCQDNSTGAGGYAVIVPAGTWNVNVEPPLGAAFGQKTVTGVAVNGPTVLHVDLPPFLGAPVIASISPQLGPPAGGTRVTISGQNFLNDGFTTVRFGATPVPLVNHPDLGTLVVDAPAGAAGASADVTVTTSQGSATLPAAFTWIATTLVSVTPDSGPPAGGTAVTLAGADFAPDSTVSFGANPATLVSVSPAAIEVLSPAGFHGLSVDVTVDGAFGSASMPGAFRYVDPSAPVLTDVTPIEGLFHQATPVSLAGSNFDPLSVVSVLFGGVPASGVTVVSPTQITCTAPAGQQGEVVAVRVVATNFASELPDAFAYVGTTLTGLLPASGPPAGGPDVTLTGTRFVDDGSMSVHFGAAPASVLSVQAPGTLVVRQPAGPAGSTVDVTVTGSNGTDTLPAAFTWSVTTVASALPNVGPPTGGDVVTLTGDQFVDDGSLSVTFGGLPATVLSVIAPHTVVVLSPPGVPDLAADVAVSSSQGLGVLPGGYRYGDFDGKGGDAINGIVGPGDTDTLFFDAVAGAKITLTARRAKGGSLQPTLRLVGPGEVQLLGTADSVVGPTLARGRKLLLPATGRYRVEIGGVSASTGPYRFRSRVQWPLRAKQSLLVQPVDGLSFEALAGWKLRKALVRGVKVKGVVDMLLPSLTVGGPDGAPLDLAGLTRTNKKGTAVTLRHLPLSGTGSYRLDVTGAAGTTGPAKTFISLQRPKSKKTLFQEP